MTESPAPELHVSWEDVPGALAGTHVWLARADAAHATPRGAATRILSRLLRVPAEGISFAKDLHGRPHLVAPAEASAYSVSTARADDVMAVAIACGVPVGVDVEWTTRVPDAMAIMPDFFTSAEAAWVASHDRFERDVAFYKCWTMKEAFSKAVGLGASFGLREVELGVSGANETHIRSVHGGRTLAEGWRLWHHVVPIGGRRAVLAVVDAR